MNKLAEDLLQLNLILDIVENSYYNHIKHATDFLVSFSSFIFVSSTGGCTTKRFYDQRFSFGLKNTGDEDGRLEKICQDTE
jgi:hypothetical protein